MAVYLAPVGNTQYFDGSGNPLVGGKILTSLSRTTTPAATYTDNTGTVPQANPIIFNALGMAASPIWLTGGISYTFVFQDAAGVTYDTINDIVGVNDPAGVSIGQFTVFQGVVTYISSTSFSVVGDQTNIFQVGRRLQSTNTGGTIFSTIQSSTFSGGITTVRVLNDSGVLDAGLSQVSYSLLTPLNGSIPANYITPPFRNRFINGLMQLDQEFVAASTTFTAAAALKYAIDQWYGYCTGANVTGQQITNASGGKRYRFTGLAGNTAVGFAQRMESQNTLDMAGGTATLQIKASSTSITSLGWAVYYANTADTFGTLAAPTRTLISSGTFTISGTETLYAANFAVPSAAITGLEVVFTTGPLLGSQTLTFGDAQIEAGAIATTIERPKINDVLLQSQRYWEKSHSLAVAPGTSGSTFIHFGASEGGSLCGPYIQFKTTKRTSPSMTFYNAVGGLGTFTSQTSGGAATPAITTTITEQGVNAYVNVGAAWTPAVVQGSWVANARL